MNERHRRWLIRAGVLCGVLIVAAVGLPALRRALLPLPMDRCKTADFDARAWRDSSQAYSETAVRGCMVDDLLARHSPVGHSRAEVVALLGVPKPTSYFSQYDVVYWLGPERGWMSIDSEWLVFRLDSAGRVKEARVATD